jgi:hypothetical protein
MAKDGNSQTAPREIPESSVDPDILAIGRGVEEQIRDRYDFYINSMVNHDLSVAKMLHDSGSPKFCLCILLVAPAPDVADFHPLPLIVCPGADFIDVWAWPEVQVEDGSEDPRNRIAKIGYEDPQFVQQVFAVIDRHFGLTCPDQESHNDI